jgi:hypothetical protein
MPQWVCPISLRQKPEKVCPIEPWAGHPLCGFVKTSRHFGSNLPQAGIGPVSPVPRPERMTYNDGVFLIVMNELRVTTTARRLGGTFHRPSVSTFSLTANSLYGAIGGPISGVRTGFAKPKKTTVPLPPKRVASDASGTLLKPSPGLSQLFATHTFPAGSTTTSVMAVCNPPMCPPAGEIGSPVWAPGGQFVGRAPQRSVIEWSGHYYSRQWGAITPDTRTLLLLTPGADDVSPLSITREVAPLTMQKLRSAIKRTSGPTVCGPDCRSLAFSQALQGRRTPRRRCRRIALLCSRPEPSGYKPRS